MANEEEKTKTKSTEGNVTTKKSANGIGGAINLSEDVVAKIAAMAARDIKGIHSLGRSRMINFGDETKRGVEAEVGNTEPAIDVDVIIEYGCDLEAVAGQLRSRIADEVRKMASRNVIEVNINVIDVKLPEPEAKEEPRRVN